MLINLVKQKYESWLSLIIKFGSDSSRWFEKEYGMTVSEAACAEEFDFKAAAEKMLHGDPGRYFVLDKDDEITVIKVVDPEEGDGPGENNFFVELDKLYKRGV